MTAHANLTGADLHESKGVSTAANNSVYVANGAGSGTWSLVSSASIDTSTFKNVNIFFLTVRIPDIHTSNPVYVPIPVNCTLNKVTTTTQGIPTVADTIVTVANFALTTIGTFTIPFSGAAAGNVATLTASVNNTFTAGTFCKLTPNAGSTASVEVIAVLQFTMT